MLRLFYTSKYHNGTYRKCGKGIGVILSLLGASGSVVRMARLVITKVAGGGIDSDGAFALSAQPLRMTITAIRTITANTTSGISINGGVRC